MEMGTVLSVAQSLFSALQDPDLKDLVSSFGFKSRLDHLQLTVQSVEPVLRDGEAKQELPDEAQLWIKELKDFLFEADDLFDEYVTVIKRKQSLKGKSSMVEQVINFFSSSNSIGVAYKLSCGIKRLRKKLDNIASDGKYDPKPIRKPKTCSYVNQADIIGREDDLESIVGMLLDSNVESHVSFLSILGFGGLGKTALAQLLYNDSRIMTAFSLRIWVCVSDDWDLRQLLLEILASATGHDYQDSTMERLHIAVKELLATNRYLLVLDDVWSNIRDEWLMLVYFLMGGQRGSWVVTTTPSIQVAKVVGDGPTNTIYYLQALSAEHSWDLFSRVAFGSELEISNVVDDDDDDDDDDLVSIARRIVNQCSGVPLAIKVLGSLLYGQDKSKWLSFAAMDIFRNLDHDIMSTLLTSYHHLPLPLKCCFAYCALFPKDFVFKKQILISLWMAQGYIVPLWEDQKMEDAPQDYFNILLQKCFLKEVEQDGCGEIISGKIQTFFHDIAYHVAGKEICVIKNMTDYIDKNVRHLTFMGTGYKNDAGLARIRSLLVGGWHKNIKMDQFDLVALMKNHTCLRTLNLSNLGIKRLPGSIMEMIHLRYLDLSQNRDLEVLPKGITKLLNLQTLILNGCPGLRELPKDLFKLVMLRVLNIEECSNLTCMPQGIGKLTRLHTLTAFVLGKRSSRLQQWSDQLEDLEALQNLESHLTIRILSNDAIYAKKDESRERACLTNKVYLKHIMFCFIGEEVDGRVDHEEVIRVLQPHTNLMQLDLYGYDSEKMPGWITLLPNVVTLHLENCRKLRYLPYLGNLVQLKVLHLVNLLNLEYVFEYTTASASGSNPATSAPTELLSAEVSSPFPSLKQLHLINLPKLKGWFTSEARLGVEDDHISSKEHLQSLFHLQLESLIIERCPELYFVPPGSSVEELSACGAETSLTKESINPATEKTHDLKIEESEGDSSPPDLSLSLNVHPPLKPALPAAMVADDAAYTSPLSSDHSPPQSASPLDDMVVDEALLYCALFPPDYEFEKSTLLQLWVADGIFDEEPMEEIAGLFFDYCFAKEYFKESRIIFLTGEAMYTFNRDNHLVPKGSHVKRIEGTFNLDDLSLIESHVSVSCRVMIDATDLCQFERFKHLRTLIFLQGHLLSFRQLPRDFFLSVKLLRALDLSQTHLVELPSSLGNLKCLRYLDLTKTPITHLPEALDCLENLQSLKLRGCSSLSTLPKGMRKLEKLRHLDFDVLRQLRSMPEGMGALTNIRTLSAFIVGVGEGRSIRQLKDMNNLSGSFCISGLQNVLMENEAVEANFCYKSQLRKLELRWSDSQDKEVVGHKKVLSSLQPNASLEELRISCYGGSELPCWIYDTTFCRLVHITLFKCEHCVVLPSVGQLLALKSLNIVGFDKLKVIDQNFYGGFGIQGFIAFPKLEKLTIQDMLSLEEWGFTEDCYFPRLSSLTVKQCPKLFSLCTLSSLRSLRELEIAHCGMLVSCLDEELPPLESFISEECPSISARILEYEEEDWLKLCARIKNVWIDRQCLNSSEGEEDESD